MAGSEGVGGSAEKGEVCGSRENDQGGGDGRRGVLGDGGGVWTSDFDHGVEVAWAVRTGQFYVNGAGPDLHAPFGGFKSSGVGRDYGAAGISAFTESKSIGLSGGSVFTNR